MVEGNIQKCAVCNKRLGFIYTTCKCQKVLCPLHKGLSDHQCMYDYKIEQIQKLKDMPLLTPTKLEKI